MGMVLAKEGCFISNVTDMSAVPLVAACPASPVVATSSDHDHSKLVNKLPKLSLSQGDASKTTIELETWLSLCSTTINTWRVQVALIWQQATQAARNVHMQWCTLSHTQWASTVEEILTLLLQRYLPSEPNALIMMHLLPLKVHLDPQGLFKKHSPNLESGKINY
eukprot:6492197-Amphidinium_carterae.3